MDNELKPVAMICNACQKRWPSECRCNFIDVRKVREPPYLDVALRDAMDRMRAAEARVAEYSAILQDVQDFVDEGGASEPCEKQLREILAGKSGP